MPPGWSRAKRSPSVDSGPAHGAATETSSDAPLGNIPQYYYYAHLQHQGAAGKLLGRRFRLLGREGVSQRSLVHLYMAHTGAGAGGPWVTSRGRMPAGRQWRSASCSSSSAMRDPQTHTDRNIYGWQIADELQLRLTETPSCAAVTGGRLGLSAPSISPSWASLSGAALCHRPSAAAAPRCPCPAGPQPTGRAAAARTWEAAAAAIASVAAVQWHAGSVHASAGKAERDAGTGSTRQAVYQIKRDKSKRVEFIACRQRRSLACVAGGPLLGLVRNGST